MKDLIHKGSVKDVYRFDENHLLFDFSNRYSLFDWGAMPDEIPGKGAALASFSRNLYCKLETSDFWQKYLSVNDELATELKSSGLRTHQKNLDCRKNQIVVTEFPCPRGDLDFYKSTPNFAFIPLEVIFRLGIPKGSSLLSREPSRYQENQKLEIPLVECSTKWESIDRMLDEAEACSISGMNSKEFDKLKKLTSYLAIALKNFFAENEVELWDGKVEWAFAPNGNGRTFMLVDSIGPDELRLTHEHVALSKEFLRAWYRKSDWFCELKEAKRAYPDSFRSHCSKPQALPSPLLQDIADTYQMLTYITEGKGLDHKLIARLERYS